MLAGVRGLRRRRRNLRRTWSLMCRPRGTCRLDLLQTRCFTQCSSGATMSGHPACKLRCAVSIHELQGALSVGSRIAYSNALLYWPPKFAVVELACNFRRMQASGSVELTVPELASMVVLIQFVRCQCLSRSAHATSDHRLNIYPNSLSPHKSFFLLLTSFRKTCSCPPSPASSFSEPH